MITVTGEYALRAMAYLASLPAGKYVLARDVGKRLDIPSNYLSKVLQALARQGMLESQRGRNGGFRLTRVASRIHLFEVLSAVEPVHRYETCILGQKDCCDEKACPIHHIWKEARGKVLKMFHETPLTKLTAQPRQVRHIKIVKRRAHAVR